MLKDKRISFLGGGNMAEALIKGLLSGGMTSPEQICASDILPDRLGYLKESYGISSNPDNAEAARGGDVVILAVKPQVMEKVLKDIRGTVGKEALIISIAAGFPLSRVESVLGEGHRLIRVMPNAPALVQEGAAAMAPGGEATEADLELALGIFRAVGKALVVGEELMDAVTGLSGSGPAYIFMLIEALADGGVKMGLSRDAALTLSAQTVLGSARMLLESGKHPGELKDVVTSPGGTTAAGVHALEKGGFRGTIISAVEAATKRSRELGGK